jgi:hypothetical protein
MKRLLGMAALAGVGVLAYREMQKRKQRSQMQAQPVAAPPVRDAGPDAMRDKPRRWNSTDERSDESFPASDPPSTY